MEEVQKQCLTLEEAVEAAKSFKETRQATSELLKRKEEAEKQLSSLVESREAESQKVERLMSTRKELERQTAAMKKNLTITSLWNLFTKECFFQSLARTVRHRSSSPFKFSRRSLRSTLRPSFHGGSIFVATDAA
ncbi:MAG: hypothetical protein QMC89_03060 [Candidatus Hodarchaeaceae archaeon]|nr:hypothetical protein [Candidatus Hodarchaeaceae archaeon]